MTLSQVADLFNAFDIYNIIIDLFLTLPGKRARQENAVNESEWKWRYTVVATNKRGLTMKSDFLQTDIFTNL